MQLSKETMLEKIYKEIARKDLSFGCKIRNIHNYYKIIEDVPSIVIRRNTKHFWNDLLDISTSKEISHWIRFDEIIWHPVMINRVEYCLDEQEYLFVRWKITHEEIILPVDEWSYIAIEALYNILHKDV